MSFGKSSSYSTPELSPEQKAQVKAQNEFFTGTLAPAYKEAVSGAGEIKNWSMPGLIEAAQNQAGIARQATQTLGETGESALRTGTAGLQSLFDPNYERNQIMAAMAPAQMQYQQNVAGQQAGFGGAGQLGSARQALAGRQLAGATQAAQMATAAQIQKDIAQQRLAAGTTLAGLGQGNIGQAISAAGVPVSAAMAPQALYNQYASVLFGTPAAAYNLGPYGMTGGGTQFGIDPARMISAMYGSKGMFG
jgi:hypothetical protein